MDDESLLVLEKMLDDLSGGKQSLVTPNVDERKYIASTDERNEVCYPIAIVSTKDLIALKSYEYDDE